MNEHSAEILPNFLREEAFPTEKRGYSKRQVDDYVVRNHNQTRDLQERLARAHDELEQLRRELAEAKDQAADKPEHEQISERMSTILRIAEEEAKEKRNKIDGEVESIRGKAEEEAAKRLKDSEEHAERVVSSARSEANEMVSTAKQEAEQLRAQAADETERRVNDAEARAKKINDTADRRLATLTATHNEAVRRLGDMHGTLAELLDAERSAGPLETGLSQAEVAAEQQAQADPGQHAKQSGPQQPQPQQGRQGQQQAQQAAQPSQQARRPQQAAQHGQQKQGQQASEQAAPPAPAVAPQQPPQAEARGDSASGAPAGSRQAAVPGGQPDTGGGPVQEESTVKTGPQAQSLDDGEESTVRLDPAPSPGKQSESAAPQPAQQAPPRPQGMRYSGPAPQEYQEPQQPKQPQQGGQPQQGQRPVPPANDPGITALHQRPEASSGQRPDDSDGTEGVRIIKP